MILYNFQWLLLSYSGNIPGWQNSWIVLFLTIYKVSDRKNMKSLWYTYIKSTINQNSHTKYSIQYNLLNSMLRHWYKIEYHNGAHHLATATLGGGQIGWVNKCYTSVGCHRPLFFSPARHIYTVFAWFWGGYIIHQNSIRAKGNTWEVVFIGLVLFLVGWTK